MKFKEQAKAVVEEAERALRGIIARAAETGDYASVKSLTSLATTLNGFFESPMATPSVRETNAPPQKAPTKEKKSRASKKKRKSKYPKFSKSGDSLVKIAWSKAKNDEYRHKAPKPVAALLAKELDSQFEREPLVSMDYILPIKGEDGGELPNYQVYLCLAWLKSIGAIEQIGREGYSRSDSAKSIAGALESAWIELNGDSRSSN